MDQQAKATAFRRFHLEQPILVLPNAWDVASAKVLAALPGCRALATSSGAVARSLGYEDGENAPAAEVIDAAARIGRGDGGDGHRAQHARAGAPSSHLAQHER